MDKHLRRAEALAKLLDNQFKIGPISFGLDPLIGLIPWIGDAVTALLAIYLIWIGHRMRVGQEKLTHMYVNVGLDLVVGMIPWLGEIADFWFKANSRNFEILQSAKQLKVEEGEIVSS